VRSRVECASGRICRIKIANLNREDTTVNVRPLHDRILVKRLETEEQVQGGIIIPDSAKEKPQEAEVMAVGPGKIQDNGDRSPMDVKKGDRVLIGKYSGSDIKIDGDEYVIIREDEVLAVVG
jgi:chaperonin GroES